MGVGAFRLLSISRLSSCSWNGRAFARHADKLPGTARNDPCNYRDQCAHRTQVPRARLSRPHPLMPKGTRSTPPSCFWLEPSPHFHASVSGCRANNVWRVSSFPCLRCDVRRVPVWPPAVLDTSLLVALAKTHARCSTMQAEAPHHLQNLAFSYERTVRSVDCRLFFYIMPVIWNKLQAREIQKLDMNSLDQRRTGLHVRDPAFAQYPLLTLVVTFREADATVDSG